MGEVPLFISDSVSNSFPKPSRFGKTNGVYFLKKVLGDLLTFKIQSFINCFQSHTN